MKPEDLKAPFTWDERRVLFQDQILYVPKLYDKLDEYQFPGWDALFDNNNPIMLEYCSGNGAWIAQKAIDMPHLNFLAVEQKFERVRKIWSKTQNHSIKNLIAICGEGMRVSQKYFSHESIQEVFINFPDPWPKTRHFKHRIVQAPFVAELYRLLKKDGMVNLVTDDTDYSNWMIAVMKGHTGFVSEYPAPFYITERPEYGTSWFDELWRQEGKEIRYHRFKKV